MLQPTGRAAAFGLLHTHLVRDGSIMLRPTMRWRGSDRHVRKGHSINNPPLTRWVCAAEPFVCRLHHHGPTSNEVGMRENLGCALFGFHQFVEDLIARSVQLLIHGGRGQSD